MDDLSLNRPAPDPRSSRGNVRFFAIAIAIAAGLHLVVFGALALTAYKSKPATPPAPPVAAPVPVPPAPIAASAIRAPAAAPAEVESVPAGTEAAPAPRPRPVEHVPVHKRIAPPVRPVHPVATPHRKPEREAPEAKAKHGRVKPEKPKPVHKKPVKPASKHEPARARAKPAGTLDLDALSKFKSSGK